MNLIDRYMEKFIWYNISGMSYYMREMGKPKRTSKDFMMMLGAPEVISDDKVFAITVCFNRNLDPEIIKNFIHMEYDSIKIKCNGESTIIKDAAITYNRIDMMELIVEMNATMIFDEENGTWPNQ